MTNRLKVLAIAVMDTMRRLLSVTMIVWIYAFHGIGTTIMNPNLFQRMLGGFHGFDDKVISMYARGMTMREIQQHIYEIYGTEVSPELISDRHR